MRDDTTRAVYWLALLLVLPLAISCGKIDKADDGGVFSDTTSSVEMQREIADVLEGAQRAILGALLPSSGFGVMGCEPEFNFVLIGIGLRFAPSDTCIFSGDVNIKFFPLVAEVDLDVVGLQYVKAISFEADIQLGGSDNNTQVDFEILDGRINLGSILPVGSLVLNGLVSFQNNANVLHLASRANAFENITTAGVALIAQIDTDKSTGSNSRSIQGCFLMGGVPDDPNAGTLNSCFTLGD